MRPWNIALLAGGMSFCAIAQTQHPGIARTADGKPDFSGSWNLPYTPNMAKDIGELPFTAEGKAVYSKVNTAYDPTGFCLYPGVPRINNSPFPMRVVQTPESVVFLVRVHDDVSRGAVGCAGTFEETRRDVHGRIDWQVGR